MPRKHGRGAASAAPSDTACSKNHGQPHLPLPHVPKAVFGIEARVHWVDDLHALPEYVSGEDETGNEFAKLLPDIARTNRQHPDHNTKEWPPHGKD